MQSQQQTKFVIFTLLFKQTNKQNSVFV